MASVADRTHLRVRRDSLNCRGREADTRQIFLILCSNGAAYADNPDFPVLHGRPSTIIAQPARQVQLATRFAVGRQGPAYFE